MPFRYKGLPREPFAPLLQMSDAELGAIGARRMIADDKPGFPCRVSLEDAEPGERLVLLSFAHQDAASPYKAAGPIFVREAARAPYDSTDMPPVFRAGRLLSARAYDAAGLMVDADVADSAKAGALESLLEKLFARADTDYIHLHYAKRGCYAARVERA
jgi:uncharacterized protein DUF1203